MPNPRKHTKDPIKQEVHEAQPQPHSSINSDTASSSQKSSNGKWVTFWTEDDAPSIHADAFLAALISTRLSDDELIYEEILLEEKRKDIEDAISTGQLTPCNVRGEKLRNMPPRRLLDPFGEVFFKPEQWSNFVRETWSVRIGLNELEIQGEPVVASSEAPVAECGAAMDKVSNNAAKNKRVCSSAAERQKTRWDLCVQSKLPMPEDTYSGYPRGITEVANKLGITRQALVQDLNKYRNRTMQR